MKPGLLLCSLFFVFLCPFLFAAPLNSSSWGFSIDLPEGYEYTGGDGRDAFTFQNSEGAIVELGVYYGTASGPAPFTSPEAMARDFQTRLNNRGDIESFEYREKKAVLMDLSFVVSGAGSMSGWALGIELKNSPQQTTTNPLLMIMAYGPTERSGLDILHLSALDSLIPDEGDRFVPGPITELAFPRQRRIEAPVFGLDINALIFPEDAEAAQALVDREYQVLTRSANAPGWQEAWKRFYRAIYRDSFDRIVNIAFLVERKLNVPERENRDFADQVLQWVQSFEYVRNPAGSDFINLVTAVTEGKGDCDNRALLWAIVLKQAGIPAAIMVSQHYSHAMGLAELPGPGARFEVEGQRLLVAETTARVSIGLIGETVSDIEYWLGISFE